ncbi:MAG: hypothetical protein JKY15_06910, partial [Deltaproteobacteria bacterium]|nr:hypothetical protein [Deltaproteobacteria bacterium]
ATTAVRGNVLTKVKNTSWYKRQFIEVDFSKDALSDLKREDTGKTFSSKTAFMIGQDEPGNPKRSRFEDGYFEITSRQSATADEAAAYGDYGEAFRGDGSALVFDVRYSFMRKPEKSSYQPLNYTNKLFDQFGFFRTSISGQQKWDRFRGRLESQKNYNATRFNIWNEDGSPKPIIYYTSVSHPKTLMAASRRVATEWNNVFKELVFEIRKDQYPTKHDVPDMFVLKENDCRVANIKKWLVGDLKKQVEESAGYSIEDIESNINQANDSLNGLSFTQLHIQEANALDDLEHVCAALEYYTQGTKNEFKYQRPGDLRYNLMNLINKRAMTPWSGYGPMFADMDTGEIIQSQANVNLWYIDQRARGALDMMGLMMGESRLGEVIFGSDVHKYMQQKMAQIKKEQENLPNESAAARMSHQLQGEKTYFSKEMESARLDVAKEITSFAKAYLDTLNPLGYFESQEEQFKKYFEGVLEPPEFIDNLVIGIALQLKNEEPRSRFMRIREAVYVATMLHEVGHNLGLMHNFSGSADPVNYGHEFWEIESLPRKFSEAFSKIDENSPYWLRMVRCQKRASDTWGAFLSTQDCLRQQEYMYSSIMDYHGSWNADVSGLGPYDKAAIFFGYGQLVEVFKNTKLAENQDIGRWLFLNDWHKIPVDLVADIKAINERKWAHYQTDKAINNRVPYRFCVDGSGEYDATCQAFDVGADMRTRAAWNRTKYWAHYFTTHFARDRIWDPDMAVGSVVSRDLGVLNDFNKIMRWYGYHMLTDPDFKNSDAAKDYLAASVTGLNHYAHVLGHPLSGEYLTTPDKPNVMRSVDKLDDCARDNVTNKDLFGRRAPVAGHAYGKIDLGDGRPLSIDFNNDYEDFHLNYVGSIYTKLAAGRFLASPGGSLFPRVDDLKEDKLFKMSWYRMFPNEVTGLFSKLIRSDWESLGPLMTPKGELVHRNILDPITLKKPDYIGLMPVMPAMADMLSFRALYYSSALLSIPQGSEENPIYSMSIRLKGDSDDIRNTENRGVDTIEFQSPIDGRQYWADKIGAEPIAYDYLVNLNSLKDELEVLEGCDAQSDVQACKCLQTRVQGQCCGASHPSCKEAYLEPCNERDLNKKTDNKKRELRDAIGFADDIRRFFSKYTNWN